MHFHGCVIVVLFSALASSLPLERRTPQYDVGAQDGQHICVYTHVPPYAIRMFADELWQHLLRVEALSMTWEPKMGSISV